MSNINKIQTFHITFHITTILLVHEEVNFIPSLATSKPLAENLATLAFPLFPVIFQEYSKK